MTKAEERLLLGLEMLSHEDRNLQAILLQSYIADKGPLSEEVAAKVRAILKKETP